LTSDYEYTGREESCRSPASSQNIRAEDVYYINGTADGVKAALCEGPITLTVRANGPFMSYSGGVMTSADCPYNNDLDHAVSAIGWKVMDGQEVLIVRNSWGTWWGDEGYIYMAMDSGNDGMGPCGIFAYPSSATVA